MTVAPAIPKMPRRPRPGEDFKGNRIVIDAMQVPGNVIRVITVRKIGMWRYQVWSILLVGNQFETWCNGSYEHLSTALHNYNSEWYPE